MLGCRPPAEDTCGLTAVTVEAAQVSIGSEGCASLELEGELRGDGTLSVRYEVDGDRLVPVVAGGAEGGELRGLRLKGSYTLEGEGGERFWRQGYQSWSWSGVVEIAGLERDESGDLRAAGDGDALTVAQEVGSSSWWAGLVGRPGGVWLHAGALSARRHKVWMGFAGGEAELVWGDRGERLTIAPGAELRLEPVRFAVGEGDAQSAWEDWADAISGELGVAPPAKAIPSGWATWTVTFPDIDEAMVRRHAAEVAAMGLAEPMVQVDDGWQRLWGDWEANERFPSGMGPLAADLQAQGNRAGLWMAPFYVHREAPIYAEHGDWWVRDEAGEPIVFTNVGSGDYVIIDTTVPEARAWAAAQVGARAAEGWDWLKLDFLYAAAQEGVRAEPVTGLEALHLGLDAIREAAPEATLLACGAPMLPVVGWADAYRSGADITFEPLPQPRLAFYRSQARSTAARAFAHGRWWWNDADQAPIRGLDPGVAQGVLVATSLAGGPWLIGDDWDDLDEAQRALLLHPAFADRVGRVARPEDPLAFVSGLDGGPILESAQGDDRVPTRWTFDDGQVALVNLSEAPVTVEAPAGTDRLSGATLAAGPLTLGPGEGRLIAP